MPGQCQGNGRSDIPWQDLAFLFARLDCAESSFVGRFWSLPLETYNLEYPIECDDEYWDTGDPETSFRQPKGKPCSITAFVSFIKLSEILGFVLKTLYSNKKSRHLSGLIGSEWEGRMVAELDSAMNKWKEFLPEYLSWDPERRDEAFFHQSVNLHATYCYIQIQIHRPYLTNATSLTPSSLAMCKNAARVCSRILEAATTRGIRVLPIALTSAFTAGMVITLSLWGCQPTGYLGNPAEDMDNLSKCVTYLKECEKRWHGAGRLVDILTEAGAMHQYGPRITNRPSPQSVPGYPASMSSTEFQGYPSTTVTINLPPPASGIEPALSTDEWNLRKLLLSEMGYLPARSSDSTHNVGGVPNSAPEGYDTYLLQPGVEAAPTSAIAHSESSAQENDLFALWSDIPAPFTSLEEWDVYYRTHTDMGQ